MHWQTHTVFNQPAPLSNSNLFLSDCALRDAVSREGAEWDSELLASIGQQLGTAESLELGRLANVNPPGAVTLRRHRRAAGRRAFSSCMASADAGALRQPRA